MDSHDPCVSIITPCYNGAKTVHRMIESVLAQTYDNIEYVFVNDGSTDDSEKVVLSYKKQFEDRGFLFKYIKQENKGLGGAINAGLKEFTGEYLCWADADDFYAPDSVKKRVEWMEEHPEYSAVTSDAYIVREDDLTNISKRVSQGIKNNEDEKQFWHLLSGESIFCCACHMLRVSDFLRVNPNREIYPARRGQNWQMLLPIYYYGKRYFLNEPLFYYVSSSGSMSRDDSTQKKLERCDEHEFILNQTLDSMDMLPEDYKKAKDCVRLNYIRKRLFIAYCACDANVAEEQAKKLKKEHKLTLRDRIYLLSAKHPRLKKILH